MMKGIEYRFDEFCLLPDQVRLLQGREDIRLSPKVFHFLMMLVSADNALVEREKLFDILWQGRAVSDESLAQVVAQCRRALGDSAARQSIVQTIPKRGYRLVPQVFIRCQSGPVRGSESGHAGQPFLLP